MTLHPGKLERALERRKRREKLARSAEKKKKEERAALNAQDLPALSPFEILAKHRKRGDAASPIKRKFVIDDDDDDEGEGDSGVIGRGGGGRGESRATNSGKAGVAASLKSRVPAAAVSTLGTQASSGGG